MNFCPKLSPSVNFICRFKFPARSLNELKNFNPSPARRIFGLTHIHILSMIISDIKFNICVRPLWWANALRTGSSLFLLALSRHGILVKCTYIGIPILTSVQMNVTQIKLEFLIFFFKSWFMRLCMHYGPDLTENRSRHMSCKIKLNKYLCNNFLMFFFVLEIWQNWTLGPFL